MERPRPYSKKNIFLIMPILWLFKSSCDPEKDFHENYMIHIMVLHGYAPGIFVETMAVEESFNM